ncbi:MAG: DUF1835 domain-containing protein, partial [Chitinophagales bacterium]
VHVLPGDALASQFKSIGLDGEIIVCRECLIEGDVKNDDLKEFFNRRADFISTAYHEDRQHYFVKVATEFEKIKSLSPNDEINLWFEYDLFCQVNMWFIISLLNKYRQKNLYRVYPAALEENDRWKGFGRLGPKQLNDCFSHRKKFSEEDLLLGENLWNAYRNQNLNELLQLSEKKSECFPMLKEVCQAEIDRRQKSRPQQTLKQITESGISDFHKIFSKFWETEAIYGFGDLQVKKMLEQIQN